MDASPVSR